MVCPRNETSARFSAGCCLSEPPPLDVTVPATIQNATALRQMFRPWTATLLGDDAADDLTLAVYEALVNAADHAFTGQATPGSMWLYATVADGDILVTIADNGTWRNSDYPAGQRGRGLPLIHQLTSEARLTVDAQGTTVYLRHQLDTQSAGQR
jgi:serine/threonine-protein kinase RsbW